jgi:predicted nucleic acid-binding protein
MKHLLDANVLLALGLSDHSLHARVVEWLQRESRNGPKDVATCAITELAFVRILTQTVYGYSVEEAKGALRQLKGIGDLDFVFFPDDESAAHLPVWVLRPHQVTDGHLVALAKRHGAVLATLDEKIPGAFVVPR